MEVPPRNTTIHSTHWARHIYQLIKEANIELLQNKDVITHFNALVKCLEKYKDEIMTYVPNKSIKYTYGIRVDSDYISSDKDFDEYTKGIPIGFCYHSLTVSYSERDQKIVNEILNLYKPLYELIKRDVVPYMERKAWEQETTLPLKRLRKKMERIDCQFKAVEEKYKKDMAECIEKINTLSAPCKVTVFD